MGIILPQVELILVLLGTLGAHPGTTLEIWLPEKGATRDFEQPSHGFGWVLRGHVRPHVDFEQHSHGFAPYFHDLNDPTMVLLVFYVLYTPS